MVMKRLCPWMLLVLVLAVVAVGCEEWENPFADSKTPQEPEILIPPEIKGTIAEYAALVSAGDTPVSGIGVVVGLGRNGSSEVPPRYRADLVKYLKGQLHIGDPDSALGVISPDEFLQDRDTALVEVLAVVPPGAPKGTKLDVVVRALPGTQTTSLQGGMLLPTEMQWQVARESSPNAQLRSLAIAAGTIFVNPFIDDSDPSQAGRFREGRILNGGRLLRDIKIRLQLFEPDYSMCNILQRSINARFPSGNVAVGKTQAYLDLNIPPQYRYDYKRFLDLVMHIPRGRGAGAYEAIARRVAEDIQQPGANHASLAMIWEAMGRSVLPTIQKVYASAIPSASFYAARAGLRLGDEQLAGPIVVDFARRSGSQEQLDAIEELGNHPQLFEAGLVLRNLLNDDSDLVRIAAYDALLKRGDREAITRQRIGDEFFLDRVRSSKDYIIYATTRGEPKIVLFGQDMPVSNPVFFTSSNDEITVFSQKSPLPEEDLNVLRKQLSIAVDQTYRDVLLARIKRLKREHLAMFRKLPGGETISETFHLDFRVADVITCMGGSPRFSDETLEIQGLGLTYSQVVGTVYQMCEEKTIPANFVLQTLPEMQRLYRQMPSMGRPNSPEE